MSEKDRQEEESDRMVSEAQKSLTSPPTSSTGSTIIQRMPADTREGSRVDIPNPMELDKLESAAGSSQEGMVKRISNMSSNLQDETHESRTKSLAKVANPFELNLRAITKN